MKEMIVEFIHKYSVFLGVLTILGIEISPIKINPLSWIFKGLGKVFKVLNDEIHKDIYSCQKEIINRLDKMEENADFKDIMEIKNKLCSYKILLQNNGLDEDQYKRCFELIERYEYYKNKYDGKVNGHMDAVINFINKQYESGVINDKASALE